MRLPLILLSSVAVGVAVYIGSRTLAELFDRFNRRHVADLQERMERLGMDTKELGFYLRVWWAVILLSFLVIGLVLGMWPIALVVSVLIYRSARTVLIFLAERQRIRIRDQLVTAARALGNQSRAGLSLAQGLDTVAKETPNPLGRELQKSMLQYHQGTPLTEVLTDLKNRLQIDGVSLLVIAVLVCDRQGGKISYALDRISRSLEELQRVERKRESDTASGRLLVSILTAFPVFFLALFFLIDPQGTQMIFSQTIGQFLLCVVGLLAYISMRWARSILAAVD